MHIVAVFLGMFITRFADFLKNKILFHNSMVIGFFGVAITFEALCDSDAQL
jgi:hypothetical protein